MGSPAREVTALRRGYVAHSLAAAKAAGHEPLTTEDIARVFKRDPRNTTFRSWKSAASWGMGPRRDRAALVLDWADPLLGFERYAVHMGERPNGCEMQRGDRGKPWGPGNASWQMAQGFTAPGNGARMSSARRIYRIRQLAARDDSGVLEAGLKSGAFRRRQENYLYRAWEAMISRCNDPQTNGYTSYGGRGIGVCDSWDDGCNCGFEEFVAFVLINIGHKPSSGYSLDRIDPNGDYEPGNIRWATREEQAQNKRTIHDPVADQNRGPLKMRALAIRGGVLLPPDGELPSEGACEGLGR